MQGSLIRRQNDNGNNEGRGNNNENNDGGGSDQGGNDQGGNNDGEGGGGNNNNDGFDSDPQESLCLVENQVSEGSKQDGQGVQEPSELDFHSFRRLIFRRNRLTLFASLG